MVPQSPTGDWEAWEARSSQNPTGRHELGQTTSLRGIWVDSVTIVVFRTCEVDWPGKAVNNPATASACLGRQDGDGYGDGKAGTEDVVIGTV